MTYSMEEFITSYGLPFHDFQELLKRINGVVTGSAALATYLKQEGIDPGFVPNDIDIFIQERGISSVCNVLVQFLRKYGFRPMGILNAHWPPAAEPFEDINCGALPHKLPVSNDQRSKKNDEFDGEIGGVSRSYYSEMNGIVSVDSYTNEAGKEIQIISLRPEEERIEDYICTQFDLSICATWWDSERFHTLNPSLTKRKLMYYIDKPLVLLVDIKVDVRIEKYLLRGFTMIDNTDVVSKKLKSGWACE